MIRPIAIFCLLFVLSCKEDKEPEVISLEELTGETGSEEFVDSSAGLNEIYTPSDLNDFVRGQLGSYDTNSHQKPHSIDRFGFGTNRKLEFRSKTKITYGHEAIAPIADFYYYTFSDTTKTKNAFYNWLDCFGEDCNVLRLNENVEELKSQPSFTLVYDTCIVSVEYLCENEKNDWKSFQDSIIANFGKSYRYRIEIGCNGPVKWKQPIKH